MLAVLAVLVLAGCTSGGSRGPSSPPPAPSVPGTPSTPATSATPATPSTPGTPGTPATNGTDVPGTSGDSAPPGGLCGAASTDPAIAACLRDALSTFWSGRLNQTVSEPVYLDAAAAQVPVACRPGITGAPAFTCRSNLTLYLNRPLLDLIHQRLPADERVYAFASVQAHEIGHVLQYRLRQPQIETSTPTAAQTRYIEQQADCLSGVWAYHAARDDGLDTATFYRVAVELVTLVSTNPEIQTHGTPTQRAAAIRRGLDTGRPQSCRLVSFG